MMTSSFSPLAQHFPQSMGVLWPVGPLISARNQESCAPPPGRCSVYLNVLLLLLLCISLPLASHVQFPFFFFQKELLHKIPVHQEVQLCKT